MKILLWAIYGWFVQYFLPKKFRDELYLRNFIKGLGQIQSGTYKNENN